MESLVRFGVQEERMAERTTDPKPEKVSAVEELEKHLRASPVVILTDYRGLTVDEIGALRGRLREADVEYRVAKNTLLAIAAERCGYTGLVQFLKGPTAVVFGRDDPGVPARLLQEFIRQYRKLEIKGGVVSGEAVNADEVRLLATLPSRAELLARAIGLIQAPLRAVAVVLSGPARGLVTALDALRAKREAEVGPSDAPAGVVAGGPSDAPADVPAGGPGDASGESGAAGSEDSTGKATA
jgi:large subunit ribosomal protein L10